jgi:hypothetical protein
LICTIIVSVLEVSCLCTNIQHKSHTIQYPKKRNSTWLLTTECTEYDVDATNLFPSQLLFTVYIYLTKEITIKSQCIFITFYILPYLNKFNFNCSSSTHIPFHIPSLTLAILKSPKYIYYRKYKISNISTLLDSNIFPNIPMQIIFSIPVVYRHTVYTDNRQLPQPNLLSELLYCHCQSTFNRRIWSSSWGNNTCYFRVPSGRTVGLPFLQNTKTIQLRWPPQLSPQPNRKERRWCWWYVNYD